MVIRLPASLTARMLLFKNGDARRHHQGWSSCAAFLLLIDIESLWKSGLMLNMQRSVIQ